MEPEATQNIIHQKHPIPSSWHIHQSVSYSKDGVILLMLISFTGRLVIYLSVAIRELGRGRGTAERFTYPGSLPPTYLHIAVDFPTSPLGSLSWSEQMIVSVRHRSGHSTQDSHPLPILTGVQGPQEGLFAWYVTGWSAEGAGAVSTRLPPFS